jgi:hypothetical protein
MKVFGSILVILYTLGPSNCGPNNPKITAYDNGQQTLVISGSGFSHTPHCAQLSVWGPHDQPLVISSLPACSNGTFNFNYAYSYVGCNPSTYDQISVSGADNPTGSVGAAIITIPWGPTCHFYGYCGEIGKRACPDNVGCPVSGGVNSNRNSPTLNQCVVCGGEGEVACTRNPQCSNSNLHPNLLNNPQGQTLCTAQCGNVNQNACVTDGSALGVSYVYHCYSGSTIDSSAVCVFDEHPDPCQEINSGNSGLPEPIILIPPVGQETCH